MSTPVLNSTQYNTASHNPTDALITQLSVGPDLREVAAVLLRQSLQKLYPALDIDPSITMLGTPSWEIVDDEIVAGPTHYQALTEILADQTVYAVPALYIEGEHFLVQQPITEPAIHLPVRIDEIANMINLLAPVMLTAFQEQQLAFWNKAESSAGPRWHELSSTLRSFWDIDTVQGWDNDDCRMARNLFRAPDPTSRKRDEPFPSKACLVSIDLIDGQNVKHLKEVSIAVLIGTKQGRTVVLTHSLLKGYERFDSLDQLGATLVDHFRLNPSTPYTQMQWRLVEPDGNFFDYQACALISIQLDVIGTLDFSNFRHGTPNQPTLPPAPEVNVDENATKTGPGLEWFKDALPDWLSSAPLPDLNNYSRHLKDLAALHSQNAGKSYLEGIPSLQQYALKVLNDVMKKDHPDTLLPDLDGIEIRVQSLVIWGAFIVPGKVDTFIFSVVDLALQNLIALPLGDKSIHSTNGKPLPAWMTVAYIEDLVSKADIGDSYPALIKSKLLHDPKESLRRQALYTQHLRIQLPLLALQCKIREQANVDARGYRYVVAVMEPELANRVVDGQSIVMRPLAFVPKRRVEGSQDVVANMFVIGPEDPTAGPCLLYRPMLDQPLSQYPSPSNLLYAIQQSPSLRESVLAWLPDDVRSDYANYVFPGTLPSPWAIAEFLVDASKLTTMTGPMALGEQTLDEDLFAALFKANAHAMVELADRQSVSNAESRWASFKHAGWIIFGAVLPFLGRTVGIAAWIWQIIDQLQQLHDAQEQGDEQAQWAALTDVLLNLGMAITMHIATRGPSGKHQASYKPTSEAPITEKPTTKKIEVKQLADSTFHEDSSLQQNLSISGAVNQTPNSLASVLDRFKIPRPTNLGTANTEAGAYRHLYGLNRKWYAPVGQNWFEVSVDDNGTIVIIDPKQPTRSGPALINNLRGEWFVDTRLRLRGGGWKNLTKVAEAQATLKAMALRTKLTAFEGRKATAQKELQQAHQAMVDATADTAPAKRQLYLQTLESQQADYATALKDLKALHVFSPTADYQQKALGYLKAQLELIHTGIREALNTFTPKLRSVLDHIERQAKSRQDRHIEDARQMSEMNQDMIRRLKHIQSRVAELNTFEKEGLRLIQQTRKLLPAYTLDDLKALQVTLARNLCLPEHTVATAADAWTNIDQIVDTADIAVQALRDTLDERSVARLDERIDTLNDLIEQFNVIDERLIDFNKAFAAQVIETPMTRLRQQLDEFNKRAANNLVLVLEERDALRARPSLPLFQPRPKMKFIRTRYNGVLIGELRLTALGLETDLVDIRSPFTNNVIATFHEKTPGVWVERVQTPASSAVAPDLQRSINAGQTLLDGLPSFTTRMTEQLNQPGRSPGGIEYLFHQQAMQLEQASSAIEQALTDRNATESTTRSAAQVNKALSDAAEHLYQEATVNMLKMIKQQPPTLSGIEWLIGQQAISIVKTITRQRLKGGKTLYLDQYTLSDPATREVLWYAHFMYSTSWVPSKAFLYARLKTPQEQRLGLSADTTKGLNEAQRLAYYRSMIGVEQAKRLFFKAG
ncbi:hypothetical protein [Pseudomonas sp. PD9R]|uniref:hypothetical protein n=1 Tax=Pseudomonas sp. PD9R TaxID=2853534 RepID=UPI001C48F415|nr:hypothetical protein [Pseudomonas sp. PD9R]MBV6825347.1 hypothetical protein [Pseudomonas sp. PD9R]